MRESRYKALLFDFDGTLLDTNELIIQTFLTVLGERFPGKYGREDVYTFIGPSLRETCEQIAPDEADELIEAYRSWNLEHHDELVREFDGVIETLEELKNLGIRLAIVSTKRKSMIARGLQIMGAAHYFDLIIGQDDVEKVKPDPEPILLALEKLKVKPDEVIMIGDNSHDIEGGKNARVTTAGVAWSIKGEAYLATFQPDYMLHHMSDLLDIVKDSEYEKN